MNVSDKILHYQGSSLWLLPENFNPISITISKECSSFVFKNQIFFSQKKGGKGEGYFMSLPAIELPNNT